MTIVKYEEENDYDMNLMPTWHEVLIYILEAKN